MQIKFTADLPFLRFVRNVAVLSILSLIPLLLIYVALQPGFAAMLIENELARARFFRQVATNGFPVVFVVNYLGFSIHVWSVSRDHWFSTRSLFVFVDLSIRLAAFIGLHVLIYVLSADWFGSFGGSKATALRVVAPTLANSALFDNISGVYLYATLISAFPFYAAAFRDDRDMPLSLRNLRSWVAPSIIALSLCGLFAIALTFIARAVTALQAG